MTSMLYSQKNALPHTTGKTQKITLINLILFTDLLTKISIEISENTAFDTLTKKITHDYFWRKCYASKINGCITFADNKSYHLLISNILRPINEVDGGGAVGRKNAADYFWQYTWPAWLQQPY